MANRMIPLQVLCWLAATTFSFSSISSGIRTGIVGFIILHFYAFV